MSDVASRHTLRNRLLGALPPNVLAEILPKLRPFSLVVPETLIVPDKPIEAVYFVESGWVSLVSTLDNGMQAEVGLIGREGMVGLPLILGVADGFEEAFVQAKGTAPNGSQCVSAGFRRDSFLPATTVSLQRGHAGSDDADGSLQWPSRSGATFRPMAAHGS
jgi:CRP-like cAMP-binding protein